MILNKNLEKGVLEKGVFINPRCQFYYNNAPWILDYSSDQQATINSVKINSCQAENYFEGKPPLDMVYWGQSNEEATKVPNGEIRLKDWISSNGSDIIFSQENAGLQPSTETSQNGLKTLNFNNDYLEIPSDLFFLPNGNSTMFIVPKVTADDSFNRRFFSLGNGINQRMVVQYSQSTGTILFGNSNNASVDGVSTTGTLTNYNIITTIRDGIQQSISLNAGSFISNNNATSSSDVNGGRLCANSSGTGFTAICEMAEVIIYDRVLSSEDINQVQIYLSEKWDIGLM